MVAGISSSSHLVAVAVVTDHQLAARLQGVEELLEEFLLVINVQDGITTEKGLSAKKFYITPESS